MCVDNFSRMLWFILIRYIAFTEGRIPKPNLNTNENRLETEGFPGAGGPGGYVSTHTIPIPILELVL